MHCWEDFRCDLLDDLGRLVPNGILSAGMVKDQIREPEGCVAAREVHEGGDASQGPLVGVADQVDALQRRRVTANGDTLVGQPRRLGPDRRLGPSARRVPVGGVAVGDPGIAVAGGDPQRCRAARRHGEGQARLLGATGDDLGLVGRVVIAAMGRGWLAQKPFENAKADPHPFVPNLYQFRGTDAADKANADALAKVEEARKSGALSGQYLANTVLFATVLFFANAAGKFEQARVRIPSFIFALCVFIFVVTRIAMLPR